MKIIDRIKIANELTTEYGDYPGWSQLDGVIRVFKYGREKQRSHCQNDGIYKDPASHHWF